jgi:hypothetical protein
MDTLIGKLAGAVGIELNFNLYGHPFEALHQPLFPSVPQSRIIISTI